MRSVWVHRDIKPANLLRLEGSERIKILDFGLARLQISGMLNANLTAEGSLLGTADYLAPEQARSASTVDIRADIYSLGCTLFHLLAGCPPFPGGSALQKVYRHEREEPPTVAAKRPDVPPELSDLVRKMMAKKPEDRHRTPAAVAAMLTPWARFVDSVIGGDEPTPPSQPSGVLTAPTFPPLPAPGPS